jgi:hypothetical protein
MSSNKPYIIALIILVIILLGVITLFVVFPPNRTVPTVAVNQPTEQRTGVQADTTTGQTQNTAPTTELPNLPPAPLAANASSAGISDPTLVLQPASLGFRGTLPPAGTPFTDPVFGTTLIRLTSQTDRGDFAIHDYSQLQAFSRDSKYVLIGTNSGSEVWDVVTRERSALPPQNNINVPRWQPALAHTLVWIDTNEDETIRVQYGNADTGAITDHFTFPDEFDRIRGNQSFDELSDDGRWMAGMATMSNDEEVIFTLDLQTKQIGARMSLPSLYAGPCTEDPQYGQVEPDWIGVSPLGNYLIVNWARDGVERCTGQEAYNIQTGSYVGHSYNSRQHGDLALTKDGKEVFITSVSDSGTGSGLPGLAEFSLPNGATSPRIIRELPWHGLWHISCRGPRDMCLITSFDSEEDWDLRGVLEQELYLIYFDGSVRRLTHHRSSGCGYWVQPRASLSYDGRYAIFDSDYNTELGGPNSCARQYLEEPELGGGEVFLVLLPEEAKQNPNNPAPFAGGVPATQPAGDGDTQAEVEGQPAAIATPQTNPNLGTTGPLPQSTYSLVGNEFVDFGEANSPFTVLLNHDIGNSGGETCFDTDFIEYDFYTAPAGSNTFTHVGNHSEVARPFLNGHEVETQGCSKGIFLYTLASGTYRAVVCITNRENLSQRYCTAPIDVIAE